MHASARAQRMRAGVGRDKLCACVQVKAGAPLVFDLAVERIEVSRGVSPTSLGPRKEAMANRFALPRHLAVKPGECWGSGHLRRGTRVGRDICSGRSFCGCHPAALILVLSVMCLNHWPMY